MLGYVLNNMSIFNQLGLRLNIILAMFSKVIGLVASFLIIPILLNALGVEQYGIWVALSSVAAWLLFFDFGLGNSFKNTVAGGGVNKTIKEYSLAFSLYFYVALFLILLFILFLSFTKIEPNVVIVLAILYLPLCVFFPLRLFSFGIQGYRLVGVNSLIETSRVFIWLSFAIYYVYFNEGKELNVLACIFVIATLVPQVCQFLLFKSHAGFSIVPKLISLPKILKEDSFKVGIRFFVIQVSSLISFNLGNVLIISNFGPGDVALYDVCNKVFVAALSVFNMVIAVVWPEFTKAFSSKDAQRCRRLYVILLLMACCFCSSVMIVAFNFQLILNVMSIDSLLKLNDNLVWSIALLTCLQAFAYCGAVLLNASNDLGLQIVLAIVSLATIIPVFYLLVSFGFGLSSYPLSTSLLVLLGVVLYNIKAVQKIMVLK